MQEPQETEFRSLGWEDPLEEEMATHSSILATITPWTEKPGGLESMRSQRVGHNRVTEHTRMLLLADEFNLTNTRKLVANEKSFQVRKNTYPMEKPPS